MRTSTTFVPMSVTPFTMALAGAKGRVTMIDQFQAGYRALERNERSCAEKHFNEVLVNCDKATAEELYWSVYQLRFSEKFSPETFNKYMMSIVSKPTHTPADCEAQYIARNNLWDDANARYNQALAKTFPQTNTESDYWKHERDEIEHMSFKVR